jgi:hypothetical protein
MSSEADPLPTMAQLSSTLSSLPPRFRLGSTGDGQSPTLATIASSPEELRSWVGEAAERFGAPTTAAAASMAVQHVARVLGSSTLMCALRFGALPLAKASEIEVGPGIESPWSFASTKYSFSLLSESMRYGDADELFDVWAEHWLDGVLNDLGEAVAGAVRVGARMLRDNIVTATASNLVIFDWWQPAEGYGQYCDRLLELGSPSFGDSVSFAAATFAGRVGQRPDRKSCCLEFKCEPPRFCPSCPKISIEERDEVLAVHLTNLAESTSS